MFFSRIHNFSEIIENVVFIVKLKKEKRKFFLQTTLLCFLDFLCCFNFCQCIHSRSSKAKTLNISLESLNACLKSSKFPGFLKENINQEKVRQKQTQFGILLIMCDLYISTCGVFLITKLKEGVFLYELRQFSQLTQTNHLHNHCFI